MRILVSGSSGLVGSALTPALSAAGHEVRRLRRNVRSEKDVIAWDPVTGTINADGINGCDAVVHLAGENVGDGRWTAAKKQRIRDSRVKGTRLLAQTVATLPRPPKVFAAASAIGYYGSRGDEIMTEARASGQGYLADVCRDWEAASQPAEEAGIRTIRLRIGVVLSSTGGALKKMLTPFRFGVGGVIGSGQQYMSWIAIEDLVGALMHVLTDENCTGAVNAVAPHSVTNREFTKTLGRVLGRPTIVPMPGFLARLAFGEMADELLLASTRVEPARLLETGYQYRHPRLEETLRYLIGDRE